MFEPRPRIQDYERAWMSPNLYLPPTTSKPPDDGPTASVPANEASGKNPSVQQRSDLTEHLISEMARTGFTRFEKRNITSPEPGLQVLGRVCVSTRALCIPAAAQEVSWGSKFSFGLKLAMRLGFRHSSLVWSCGLMQEHIKHGPGTLCVTESSLASLPL